ncbi:hypothetical protein B2I21_36670 [Chryseobacterium mucoviscidosis]|nr:hypothetical protein B2I21_36670 [Chryseobacterium mucoviscidosis]
MGGWFGGWGVCVLCGGGGVGEGAGPRARGFLLKKNAVYGGIYRGGAAAKHKPKFCFKKKKKKI